jgi:GT2 family glycosyltransferase
VSALIRVSCVILTHNRRDALLRTLRRLDDAAADIVVVDNASEDGTAAAVAQEFPSVTLLRRPRNEGSAARNLGAAHAKREYIVFLDDDSSPLADTLGRSIEYMDANPRTAAVGGRVILPDQTEDAAALPIVLPACAMFVRRCAFEQVGGFSPEFFRQAEEYDLVFRLLRAEWRVERYEDLLYRHEKVAQSRSAPLILQMDLRNNLILVERFLPRDLRRIYRRDWLRRYVALAKHQDHVDALPRAIAGARSWAHRERRCGRSILPPNVIEAVFQLQSQRDMIGAWAEEHDVRRVVVADLSKNIHATLAGCAAAGIEVAAIAENHPAFAGSHHRGLRVVADKEAAKRRADGIVLSTVNPARVGRRLLELKRTFDVPILTLWKPQTLPAAAAVRCEDQ